MIKSEKYKFDGDVPKESERLPALKWLRHLLLGEGHVYISHSLDARALNAGISNPGSLGWAAAELGCELCTDTKHYGFPFWRLPIGVGGVGFALEGNNYFQASDVPTTQKWEYAMKQWVRLHKDGDHMGVETNCTDEREFWSQFSAALADAIENKFLGHAQEQLQKWLPQGFECVAQLRGYKANVVVEQIVKAGEVYSGSQEVFTSEKPRLAVVAKENAG